MGLPDFAERFAAAGFVTLAFDYRYFGDSEGEPRCQLFPLEQVEDVRNAITWVSDQPEVDPQRIGVWGTSYGGGIVVYTATFDRRIKAVVAQVPATVSAEFWRALDPKGWDVRDAFFLRDRIERYRTGAVNYMKVVAPEGEPCAFPGRENYEGYRALAEMSPNWRNQVTIESLEKIREFDSTRLVHWVAPTALLLIAAEKDSLIPVDAINETFERAQEPKALLPLPIKHFDIYYEPWFSKAAGGAIDWFTKYL
jgi:dienelactone hydrolase